MDYEEGLAGTADRYRSQGYRVVVRPGPDDLPDFAKTFRVEIVARRGDGSALVSVKRSRKEFAADPHVAGYAGVIDQQPGWRFDVVVLGPDEGPEAADYGDATEPSDEEIRHRTKTIRGLLDDGANQEALVLAWSVLEAAMRRRLRDEDDGLGPGTSVPTMLNELVSSGGLPSTIFRDLEGLFRARSAIVHGFTAPAVEPGAVNLVLDTARGLLEESRLAGQPA